MPMISGASNSPVWLSIVRLPLVAACIVAARSSERRTRPPGLTESAVTRSMSALMKTLGAEGIASVLVEGGSRISGSALRSGIVDKIYFFYAPKLLGGDDGIPICRGQGQERMQDCLNVDTVTVHRFGSDVMIEGYLNPDYKTR